MKHSRIVQNAIKDVRKIKACGTHRWVGPIKEVEVLGIVVYEVRCENCPAGYHFSNRGKAMEAIK